MKNSNTRRIQMPLCCKTLFCELSNDFTLPDYLPEIRKVIGVRVLPMPPAKYISSNTAELCAGVDYQLLYISSEGEPCSAPFNTEYEFSLPIEGCADFDLNEGITLLADIFENGITTRVTAPRKLNIKCRLGAHVRAYGTMIIEEEQTGEVPEESIERLSSNILSMKTLSSFSDEIPLSSQISRDTSELRIIDASAEIIPSSIAGGDGYADVKACAFVTLLATTEGDTGSVFVINQKIPFDTVIEFDEFTKDANYRAKGYLNNLEVSVEEGSIQLQMSVTLEAIAQKNIPVEYTKDLYSTENSCEIAYEFHSIPASLRCFNSQFSQSERIQLEEGSSLLGSQIIYAMCQPSFERYEYESKKAYVCGQSKYLFLLNKDGEYSTYDLAIPFRFETECEAAPTLCSACLGVISCNARIDGSSLAIDSELSLSLELAKENTVRMVSEARFGDKIKKESGDMIICYPESEESLWSLSKKYSVPVLKRSDRDAEASIADIGFVVINM